MKNFFKNSYRVVRDNYMGYEAQFRPWWSPFWFQCYGTNSRSTLASSEALCHKHATPVASYIGKLP